MSLLTILRTEAPLCLFSIRAPIAMASAHLPVEVHNPRGRVRVISTKPMPGSRWIKLLVDAGFRVEVSFSLFSMDLNPRARTLRIASQAYTSICIGLRDILFLFFTLMEQCIVSMYSILDGSYVFAIY